VGWYSGMTAVWMFFRAESRGRWRSWLALALLAGLFGGLVVAVAVGARRTDAAYPSLVAWSGSPDDMITLTSTEGPTFASLPAATVARLPQVTGAAELTAYTALEPAVVTVEAPADGQVPRRLWRRKLLAGRLPDPGQPDQVDVSFTVAQSQHVGVGATLPVVLLGATGRPVPFRFRVVGIDATPSEFPPQFGTGVDLVWATPAFARQHGRELLASPGIAVWLRHGGADVPVIEGEITRLSGGKAVSDYPLGLQAASTEHSIHQQAVVLWLLAGLLALLGVLLLGQLLARLSLLESASYGALRAVGMSRAQLAATGLIRAAAIGAAGAVAAVIVAVAASPLFPLGLARIAEPHPGIDADWPVLGLGMLGVMVATVSCAAWPAWRAATAFRQSASDSPRGRASTSAIVWAVRPVSAATGVWLALRRGTGRTALPVPSTIAAAALGVTALSAAVVFTASLGHLLATPMLYGVTWNAMVGSPQNSMLAPVAQSIAHDPQVSQWSGTYLPVPVEIRGVQIGAITTGPGPDGSLAAVPLAGRLPHQAGDIVLGERTLAAIHARIGDTVGVSIADFRRQSPRKIVGTAVFPAMSDTFELGTGAELTVSGLRGLAPRGLPLPSFDGLMVRFRPGVSPQRGIGVLAARVDRLGPFQVLGSPTPTDLVNFAQVQALPLLLGLSIGVLALLTIVHLLLTSVRRRRRDLAVLRAIGFTRRQVRAAVAWQAASLTAVALVIGIPVGIVCGRLAWLTFAGQFGFRPVLNVPAQSFAVLVAAALALAVAVAAVPGESAARPRPADVLRAE
jgi:hypothetical protein